MTQAVLAIADELRDATAMQHTVRIVGAATWRDANRPVTSVRTVETRGLSGVREYVPGDLVITVGAGTSLREIAAITGEQGQWLALDPFGSDEGTIGATIATASCGPMALGAGRVRDLTLGLTVLTADGTAVRAGGRVVKNVAGFDLVRLAAGAFGTLGVITEASLRLHARPAVDETYAVLLEGASGDAVASLAPLGMAALGFQSLQLLDAGAVARCKHSDLDHVARGAAWVLVARVAGNRARSTAQREVLASLGAPQALPTEVWTAMRAMDGEAAGVARVSAAPAGLSRTIASVNDALAASGASDAALCVTPHTGSVRLVIPDAAALSACIRALRVSGLRTIWERMPADCWSLVPAAATDVVSVRIRDAFDPLRLLNRGIFGGDTGVVT